MHCIIFKKLNEHVCKNVNASSKGGGHGNNKADNIKVHDIPTNSLSNTWL